MACMKKGVNIHVTVKAAHSWWSSTNKVMKVAKSVETSERPNKVLKNVNLITFDILGERGYKKQVNI